MPRRLCVIPIFLAPSLALAGMNDCAADFNNDGSVDSTDLNVILAAFGTNASGDLDGDADTDSTDLNVMLASFGATGCNPPDAPPCCAPGPGPACADELCMQLVCAFDPACCTNAWDQACADAAATACPVCLAGLDSCCYPHAAPGCIDPACQAEVCDILPSCCEVEWELQCAYWAFQTCPGSLCYGIYYGPCCEDHAGQGCDDPECTELICKRDPYCCEVRWDEPCATEACFECEVCQ